MTARALRLLLMVPAFCAIGARTSVADLVLSDNLSQPSFAIGEVVQGPRWITSSFGTDSNSYDLSEVTVKLFLGGNTPELAELSIFTDDAFKPGSLVGTLQSPSIAPDPMIGETTFTASDIRLAPNSTYWVVMRAITEAYEWKYALTDIGDGVGFQHNFGISTDAGVTWDIFDSEPMLMRVRARPVPEPSSLLALGIGIVCVLGYARHRRR